jgi:hypothetical protein
MTVVLSIVLAAIVGGVVFVLLDNWQRRSAISRSEPDARGPELWTPDATKATTQPLFVPRTNAPAPFREHYAPPEEHTEPLPRPRHGLWDDPRDPDEDDDRRPPGLWSGWAR